MNAAQGRTPLGVQRFGEMGSRTVTYIGIPALDGNTWPLRWYSEPTVTTPFVEAGRLRRLLKAVGAMESPAPLPPPDPAT
jgi:hypothetical protein